MSVRIQEAKSNEIDNDWRPKEEENQNENENVNPSPSQYVSELSQKKQRNQRMSYAFAVVIAVLALTLVSVLLLRSSTVIRQQATWTTTNTISNQQQQQQQQSEQMLLLQSFQQQHQHQPQQQHRKLTTTTTTTTSTTARTRPRILYIITTLAEYNTGARHTERGSDRLQETTIPVMAESVRSFQAAGYDVDVYLICHFILTPERQKLVEAALPSSQNVKLEVWNDATPLGYDTGDMNNAKRKIQNRTLHLARQHRFVIKDKLLHYDIFAAFEDDMLITGDHVQHFTAVSDELERLYQQAPEEQPSSIQSNEDATNHYYGTMTKGQLKRMIPGFIRVEVLLNEKEYGAQSDTGPVPVDLKFTSSSQDESVQNQQQPVDSSVCCHLSPQAASDKRPATPTSDQIMLWETHIMPVGVRKMPDDSWLDWVLMQRGPNQANLPVNEVIGDYWTNRNYDYYPKQRRRPAPQEFKYINNQGGWMATQQQLIRWHTDICPGGFLPPYEPPHYNYDGLDMRNVEWYSGGMQLATIRHACNMQRIILLDPTHFSKSLLYHTANNKQKQLAHKREESFTKANTFLGQLNTIRKRAEQEIKR